MSESYAQRKLRQYRRENGLCIRCGDVIPIWDTHKQCESCRAMWRERYGKFTSSRQPARKPSVSISEVCRMAAERHISYGEMVLILEKEDKQP